MSTSDTTPAVFVQKLPIKKQIRYQEMRDAVLDPKAVGYMKRPRMTLINEAITGNYPSIELQDKRANPYGKDISDLTLQGPVNIEQHNPKGWPKISSKGMTALKIQQLEAFGFRREGVLGEGSFGEVWRVTDIANNREFAGKVLPLHRYYKEGSIKEGIAKLMNEVEALRGLTHPNLGPIDEVIHVRDEKYMVRSLFVIILMGLCDGDLTILLAYRPGYFNEGQAHKWFVQIAGALHYLHSKRVCHMDIKPQNILYTGSANVPFVFKLADFGLAQRFEGSAPMEKRVAQGTFLYMAPEVRNIRNAFSAVLDVPKFVSNHPLMRLLFGMIEDNPTQRFTMDQVVQHPWVIGAGSSGP
ncbi:unnamed protein product [Oppiella nova]|uniref:Protein kinase domain-containing protein n=1 Tax=Oppiella nova TaxID=334625 RepID=A0A7R9LY98_9ACAR|nr:unnamed protein product [Oppiella nova]CAG2168166.1 unnamed protein product [Oppiella nova]